MPGHISLLEIKNLNVVVYVGGQKASIVHHVDLEIRSGECVGLVGESGCGKSSLALAIMGLLPNNVKVESGLIQFMGLDLLQLSEKELSTIRGRHIGIVFQDPMSSLNPTMTIGEQVAEPAQVHLGLNKKQAMRKAEEMLALVGMPNVRQRLNEYPHTLSGGMRQRVMIAMALICEPVLLILDEPTSSLDVTIQAQILELVDRMRAKLGMAVLLITHDLAVIAGRADRVAVMYAGSIVEIGDTEHIFYRPKHPYTYGLLRSAASVMDAAKDKLFSIEGSPPDPFHLPSGCKFHPRCFNMISRCKLFEPMLIGQPDHLFACFNPVRETSIVLDKSER